MLGNSPQTKELNAIFEEFWGLGHVSRLPFPIAPLDYRLECGDNCLHIAVCMDHLRAVDLLLDMGMDINSRGHMGNTALHYAAVFGFDASVYKKLLERGADESLENDANETALERKKKSEKIFGVDVIASICFRTTDDGGRRAPVTSGYRPNHLILPAKMGTSVGEVMFDEGSLVYPGEEIDVKIQFMNLAGLIDYVNSGFEWGIYEGDRFVATGKIISVLGYSSE